MSPITFLFLVGLMVNGLAEFVTTFDGVWDFTYEDRQFRAYICPVDSENIYLSIKEIWTDDKEITHQYTIGVAHGTQISESDKKVVVATTDAYVLSPRSDKAKHGYFSSIVILRYEKKEDSLYLHFKLTKKSRPTNIKLRKDETQTDFERDLCWIPQSKDDVQNIYNKYPQIWKTENEQNPWLTVRNKEESGCWGSIDSNGDIQNTQGGHLSSIQLQYKNHLILTKWFDIGHKYSKDYHCISGSAMFLVIEPSFALWSLQCNDGKTGYEYRMKLSTESTHSSKYQCPLLPSAKTDL